MVNVIKKTINWIFNKDNRQTIGVPLQSDISHENKALRQENASLKAQIGSMFAEKREEAEQVKEKDQEQEVIKDLKLQQKEISLNRFGDTVSLLRFAYEFVKNKKFRENLELTDKDDTKPFSKLGDILFTQSGHLLITDVDGNPMSYGKSLSDVIYKPETFGTQLKRGRILLPFDKDFNFVRDFEELEINDVVYDEDEEKFRETEEYRAKARELLMRKVNEIREKSNYIQRLEAAQTGMQSEINDQKRALLLYKNKSYTAETNMSMALAESNQLIAKREDMNRKIATLSSYKALSEERIQKLEEVIKTLLSRFEQADKTQYEQIKEEIQADIEWAKNVVPEQVIIKEEHPKEQLTMPSPGQVLKK
jgi:hypothetical protein